jgi:hypothetical protein
MDGGRNGPGWEGSPRGLFNARAETANKQAGRPWKTSFGAQFIGDNRCRAALQLPQRSHNNYIML